jgi:hypothetical protein
VVLPRLEEDAVAGTDRLDRAAATPAERRALGDIVVCPNGWVASAPPAFKEARMNNVVRSYS